ncbi:MAG: bifunctional oligoribonuclease/PAP phosphatase NrnA [Actinomycetia bacterium]|nr:bifunctional oligoribonuclease/PAP phosphatase NrnA [Actinomycetes bacterium]
MKNNGHEALYTEITKKINDGDDFLIITHIFPDGDALGAITACHKLISSMGKNSNMICKSSLPYQYSFLPGFSDIKQDFNIKDLVNKKTVCIVIDCADEERTGLDFGYIRKNAGCIINMDHHRSNSLFGDINMVDSSKSAASEILFELLDRNYRDRLNYDIAIGIYVGILTDTGRFQYSNTTANVHRITSKLLEFGIHPSDVYGHIYESDPMGRFKLVQKVFKRIKYIESLGLIYSYVLKRDFSTLNIPFYAQDGIIELLRSAEGAKIAVLFKQADNNSYKISLRTSEKNIDLSEIASGFGGGGHRTASAYKDEGSLNRVISRLKDAVREGTKKWH